jgi:hypothetical protein
MKVPFLDLSAHHAAFRTELDGAFRDVVEAGAFAGGPFAMALMLCGFHCLH